MEERIAALEKQVAFLTQQMLLLTTQNHVLKINKNMQKPMHIPKTTFQEWLQTNVTIDAKDYLTINEVPYHECISKILAKKIKTTRPEHMAIVSSSQNTIQFYSDLMNEWRPMELSDVKDALEHVNLLFHDYYFAHVEPLSSAGQPVNEKTQEIINMQFCKMNENKFRHENRLRESRKRLLDVLR
jgi:hypothetical protein